MKTKRYSIIHFSWVLLVLLSLTGCTEEVLSVFSSDGEIKEGEPVLFSTYMPVKTTTRTTQEDFENRMKTFEEVRADYEFTVEMYEKDNNATALGSALYTPTTASTTTGYVDDGTLTVKESTSPLYWPSSKKEYGFKAWAKNTALSDDQQTEEKLFAQDYVEGYGFEPIWDADETKRDNEDALNYRTPKGWYDANVSTLGLAPGGVASADFYKKIPLYLKHKRSKITVILKAGEGVKREDLIYEKAITNIETQIFSYKGQVKTSVSALSKATTVIYGTETEGTATTQYTAIVEPYNYMTNPTEDKIAQIKLSGQTYSFYASNDSQYKDYDANDQTNTATQHMNGYNLAAGKHLIITAILGRESRKILITAYVEDWVETPVTTVVDDYGQAGDPVQIKTRKELYDFLNGSNNKPGYVAIIVPNSLNLEKDGETAATWVPMPLNCTLNMAGATFFTDHQVFSTIGPSGNLVNGTIAVGNAEVPSAVASVNDGTVERVNVVTKDASGTSSIAKATSAGLIVTNYGTITDCSSVIPVQGTTGYIGGIAAVSTYSSENGATMPVIDRCTVNASVGGNGDTKGGGIVGQAVGRVSNNTFEYGITISQDAGNFKNIIYSKADNQNTLRAYSNSWPTTATNAIGTETTSANVNGTAESDRYTAVIDSQTELKGLVDGTYSGYNTSGNRVRISNDFIVTHWEEGKISDQSSGSGGGNVFFELNGNNKTITTDGMLFSIVQSHVYDLTVKLSGNLIATTKKTVDNVETTTGGDAIAPFAYSVYGSDGKLSNIKVKGGDYLIQAANPGGVVVWAYGGATIENCQCKANIQAWRNADGDGKNYAGGIVACAEQATITQCKFHNYTKEVNSTTISTLGENLSTNYAELVTVAGEGTKTASEHIYFGGILGGTIDKSTTTDKPSVLITDCSSWYSTSNSNNKGAIVGYAIYDESGDKNGIASGCQGNWWSTSSEGVAKGIYTDDEKVIGKRNAVEPTEDSSY